MPVRVKTRRFNVPRREPVNGLQYLQLRAENLRRSTSAK
jgi:hypothetical protein